MKSAKWESDGGKLQEWFQEMTDVGEGDDTWTFDVVVKVAEKGS